MSDEKDPQFAERRKKARIEVNKLDAGLSHNEPERGKFFNTVYDRAQDDAAQIPWADMAPKPHLSRWLADNPGNGKTAIDIACGLGDNAQALAQNGYETEAFDLSDTAINWAKERFPKSSVNYQVANVFEPLETWRDGFDLVNECYTLQALPPPMLEKTTNAIAQLVKVQGILLVYTRLRADVKIPDGPPWPLHKTEARKFAELGFELEAEIYFDVERGERKIPHQFAQWRKIS